MSRGSVYDVVVVGSGPAGASAALALARAGARVAVLEKAALPRYKTCGGGLVRRAVKLLPVDVGQAIERDCDWAEVRLSGTSLVLRCRRPEPVVSMTMRDRLDFLLVSAAREAGADVQDGCEVLAVRLEGETVVLETSRGPRHAWFVVAADGALSPVARQAGWPETRRLVPALECEVFVDDEAFERLSQAARFDVGAAPRGYGWVFPKREHLSIGVASVRRGRVDLPAIFQRYVASLGLGRIRRMERHGFVVPVVPREGPFVRRRVLLAGDAAGLVEPVTGEGITFAVLSAQLAARALLAGGSNEERVREAYEWDLASGILPELRCGRILAGLTYGLPRLRTALARLNGTRFLEALTDVFAGRRTYREILRNPSTYLKLFTPRPAASPASG